MATITQTKREEQRVLTADIGDAAPIKTWDSTHPWVPQVIAVTYRRNENEPWQIIRIQLSGPRLLKSGSLSALVVNAKFYDVRENSIITHREGPTWAWEWADANLPAS